MAAANYAAANAAYIQGNMPGKQNEGQSAKKVAVTMRTFNLAPCGLFGKAERAFARGRGQQKQRGQNRHN